MTTVYVNCKSKAQANRDLKEGKELYGIEYTPFSTNSYQLSDLPNGAVIKFFTKFISGNPLAKSYGQIARKKDGSLFIK